MNALKKKQYAVARRELAQSVRGPITDLTATLLSSWAQLGAKDAKGAVAAIDKLQGPDWYAIFKDLHAGLISDLAGDEKEAGKRYERAYKARLVRAARCRGLWQLGVAATNRRKTRSPSSRRSTKRCRAIPLVVEAMKKLKAGEKLPVLVNSVQAGAAEALYGLGASLGRRGGEDLGVVYLQLSLDLAPNHPHWRCCRSPIIYELLKKPELAIRTYDRVPASSPLHRNAEIQMAANLDTLDRNDEAEKHFDAVIKRLPGRSRSHHGARQRAARPQEVRRMRRRLFKGRRARSRHRTRTTG